MTDRVTFVVCVLASGGGFGVVGTAFGALASRSAWRNGHAGGGVLGRYVVNALNRVRDEDVPPETAAVLGGAIDGGAFLAVIGGGLGAWAAVSLAEPGLWLLLAFATVALLAVMAAGFGLIGYVLVGAPDVRSLGFIGIGGLAGALAGGRLGGEDGILLGTAVGAAVGFLVASLRRPPPNHPDSSEPETPS